MPAELAANGSLLEDMLLQTDLDDWGKTGTGGVRLLSPDLGEVGKTAEFLKLDEQVAWLGSIRLRLCLDMCHANEKSNARSHVAPPDSVGAAHDLEVVETSEPVEPLTRVAAARKRENCSGILLLTGP